MTMSALEFLRTFCNKYGYALRSISIDDDRRYAAITIDHREASIFAFAHNLTEHGFLVGERDLCQALIDTSDVYIKHSMITYCWPHIAYSGD